MPMPKTKGKRTRFPGFVLTKARRDRVVAKWIDDQPNASEAIKQLIYQVATGQLASGQAVQVAKPQTAPLVRESERQEAPPSAFTAGEEREDIPDVNTEDPDAAALFGAFGN